jgi:hypothetical protein
VFKAEREGCGGFFSISQTKYLQYNTFVRINSFPRLSPTMLTFGKMKVADKFSRVLANKGKIYFAYKWLVDEWGVGVGGLGGGGVV